MAAGGTALVWLALDTVLERDVVLKVARHEVGASVDRERFARERNLLARLAHPFILPVFEAGVLADGRLWMALPFYPQRDVDYHLRERQVRVSPAAVVQFGLDVAEALHFVHAQGWVHRDIKPHNVFMAGRRFVLGDFGIAAPWGATAGDTASRPSPAAPPQARAVDVHRSPLTGAGRVKGTLEYLPASRLRGLPATPAHDCFSLCVSMWELLARRRAFVGERPEEALAERLRAETTLPAQLPDVPVGVVQVVRQGMLGEDGGYADADALRSELLAAHRASGF